MRVKLATEGSGRWRDSAGEKSKFGLFITEILELLATLKARDMLDCLKLVHCHPGSQLQDIRRVKDAINELAHVYAELKLMGAGLEYIDVGGGLGVDYDGSATNYPSSMNYTLNEYASDVVYRIGSVCNARNIPHPLIISESGRAIAAHHSVLIFNVLGRSALDRFRVDGRERRALRRREAAAAAGARPARRLPQHRRAAAGRVLSRRAHGARSGAADVQSRAAVARVPRTDRAAVLGELRAHPRPVPAAASTFPEELEDLENVLSDTYFCNFSIFQSLPDSWAIDQLFPIMPIHRLGECADAQGGAGRHHLRLGRQDRPLRRSARHQAHARAARAARRARTTTSAPSWSAPTRRHSGDLHNLFGDTHVVHIKLHDEGGWWIEEIVKGDTANRVLEYMEYDVAELAPALARDCERAVREGRLTVAESQALKRFYENELNGYAYLEP